MKLASLSRLLVIGAAAALALAPISTFAAVTTPLPDTSASSPNVRGDFNGDGFSDLAIGIPSENFVAGSNTGAVQVLYGSASGLSDTGGQFWTQGSGGTSLLGGLEVNDNFGAALAAGDFNGDGFDDLAVGAPGEDVGSTTDAGAVNVIYGSANGLTASGNQFWEQSSSGIVDASEQDDHFGAALSAGDYNGDGRDDLAIGVPDEDLNGNDAGAVNIIYGSSSGLAALGNQIWSQGTDGIQGTADANDHFGTALASGDFSGDGRDDLAIGVPYENRGLIGDCGAVNVLYGSASGITATGNQFWYQNAGSVLDSNEGDDHFGAALAAGNFNGDTRDDLAIGVPGEDIGNIDDAGAVSVLYGASGGLTDVGNDFWSQDSSGILDLAEAGDHFGAALVAGNFNGDSRDDLAIGAPDEDAGSSERVDAGAVSVLYGGSGGLAAGGDGIVTTNQFWHEDSVQRGATTSDKFGFALVAGNFNGDTRDDLAVGVPFKDIGFTSDVGAVIAIYGTSGGLSATGNQLWNQGNINSGNGMQGGDQFGGAL